MSFPSHAGHSHVLPMTSHSHTIQSMHTPNPSICGFKNSPIEEKELEEGEVLCDVCNGFGYDNNPNFGPIVCKKCQGIGKLDWIERIVGRKEITPYSGVSGVASYSGMSGSPGVYGGMVGTTITRTKYASHAHTISPSSLPPPVGIVMNESLSNETKIFDGEKWVPVEPKKRFSNKILNGLKKFLRGCKFDYTKFC